MCLLTDWYVCVHQVCRHVSCVWQGSIPECVRLCVTNLGQADPGLYISLLITNRILTPHIPMSSCSVSVPVYTGAEWVCRGGVGATGEGGCLRTPISMDTVAHPLWQGCATPGRSHPPLVNGTAHFYGDKCEVIAVKQRVKIVSLAVLWRSGSKLWSGWSGCCFAGDSCSLTDRMPGHSTVWSVLCIIYHKCHVFK